MKALCLSRLRLLRGMTWHYVPSMNSSGMVRHSDIGGLRILNSCSLVRLLKLAGKTSISEQVRRFRYRKSQRFPKESGKLFKLVVLNSNSSGRRSCAITT